MGVIAWQPLAWPSVADDQRLMRLATMGNPDDVTETGLLGIFGQLDTVRLIQSRDFLGVFTIVDESELGE